MTEQLTGRVAFLADDGQEVAFLDPAQRQFASKLVFGVTVPDGDVLARRVTSTHLEIGLPNQTPATIEVANPAVPGGSVLRFDARFAVLDIGGDQNEGDLRLRDNANRVRFHLDAGQGTLFATDSAGRLVVRLRSESADLDIGSVLGAGGNSGDVRVRDQSGAVRIHLDGATGNINTSGGDCAEKFPIDTSQPIDPGTVVVIDDQERMCASSNPYDRRVAGVLSGAGGLSPGVVLGSQNGADECFSVALAGRVFCKVDGTLGQISAGDLLTTSATTGHAMKVDEPARAVGSILGKALRPWNGERGLIPILIALQ